MANRHLRRAPHRPRKSREFWWYEEPDGIRVYANYPAGTELYRVGCFTIPWKILRNALARKDKTDA